MFFLLLLDQEDGDFLASLYMAHYRLLYAQALKVLRNPEDAEDAVSTGMLSLTGNTALLKSLERNKQEAYLVITIRNAAINLYRQRRRHAARRAGSVDDLPVPDPAPGPEQHAFAGLGVERLKQAIRQLPEREQQALMMRFFQQLTDEETARRMDVKPVSVRALVSRGRARLAKLLGEGGDGL